MSKLITIAIPEDWDIKEDLLLEGTNTEFLSELEEVLLENDLLSVSFKPGKIISIDSEDYVGDCVITLDTEDGSIFLLQVDSDIPYGKSLKVVDNNKISLEEMDIIVEGTYYYW